jgi:hypothetical protein
MFSYLVHYLQMIKRIANMSPSTLFEHTGGNPKEWLILMKDNAKLLKSRVHAEDQKLFNQLSKYGKKVFDTVSILIFNLASII